jgi:hypothetical protein
MMDYLVGKLVTGETIVALAGDSKGAVLQLVCPFEVTKESVQEGDYVVVKSMLRPYCPYTDDKVLLMNPEHFLYIAPLKPDLIEAYKSMVESYEASPDEPTRVDNSEVFYVDPVDTVQ